MYKIGPYCFDLQGFYRNDICESWLWKLDAFRVHASISLSADMRIEYNPKKKIDYNGKSMESHLSGFYEIRNYLNDGYWIWDLIRKRSEQMILQFAVNDRFSEITLTHDMSNSDGNAAFEALSDIIFPCMLTSEILTFHGVLMEYDGYGIILSRLQVLEKQLMQDYGEIIKMHLLLMVTEHPVLKIKDIGKVLERHGADQAESMSIEMFRFGL